MSNIDAYLAAFRSLNGAAPSWLRALRADGMERFAALGFPTTQLEDWKYTNVAPIAQTSFHVASSTVTTEPPETAMAELRLGVGSQLVFVNGRYAPSLSAREALPPGTTVESLATALQECPQLVEPHLGRYATFDTQGFTALNTAFITDGAFIALPRGAILSEPIHLVFLSAAPHAALVAHPRTLIVAAESSQATVVETYVGLDGQTYLTNAVTEIVAAPNSSVAHYVIQRQGTGSFHVSRVEVRQAADSRLASYAVSLGGALVRVDINTVLDGPGGECRFDGLYLASGRQHVDHHTSIDHRAARCTSRELYKGVLDGKSTSVFNGKVFVRPDAQQSDAQQVNKNLLLSDAAIIDTKPQLEIFADDVKCSHGATIGRLDDAALFYLRARGIDAGVARDMLIYAFANELIGRMPLAPVRAQLERLLGGRLQQSITLEGAL